MDLTIFARPMSHNITPNLTIAPKFYNCLCLHHHCLSTLQCFLKDQEEKTHSWEPTIVIMHDAFCCNDQTSILKDTFILISANLPLMSDTSDFQGEPLFKSSSSGITILL